MAEGSLSATLRRHAEDGGAQFFGIADLDGRHEAFGETWPLPTTGLRFGISIGIGLNHWIVDRLSRHNDATTARLYGHHGYTVVNDRLDRLASDIALAIQRRGFQAVPVPATIKANDEGLLGPFTHKAAARLAGLGWIGLSCLLVTPEVGPRVRWATVLTDAPLAPTGKPMANGCGDCAACVKVCPALAFTGRPFREDEPIALRYDTRKCQNHLRQVSICGLCLAVCPHGRKERTSQDPRAPEHST